MQSALLARDVFSTRFVRLIARVRWRTWFLKVCASPTCILNHAWSLHVFAWGDIHFHQWVVFIRRRFIAMCFWRLFASLCRPPSVLSEGERMVSLCSARSAAWCCGVVPVKVPVGDLACVRNSLPSAYSAWTSFLSCDLLLSAQCSVLCLCKASGVGAVSYVSPN